MRRSKLQNNDTCRGSGLLPCKFHPVAKTVRLPYSVLRPHDLRPEYQQKNAGSSPGNVTAGASSPVMIFIAVAVTFAAFAPTKVVGTGASTSGNPHSLKTSWHIAK